MNHTARLVHCTELFLPQNVFFECKLSSKMGNTQKSEVESNYILRIHNVLICSVGQLL